MRIGVFILIGLFFLRCVEPGEPRTLTEEEQHQKLVRAISKELWVNHALEMSGFGGGADPNRADKVGHLNYMFDVNRLMTREEARVLLIQAMEEVLTVVNQSDYARDHMGTFPCTANQIDLYIYLFIPNREAPEPPYIGAVTFSSRRGVKYRTEWPDVGRSSREEYYESYEEAVRLVREQERKTI